MDIWASIFSTDQKNNFENVDKSNLDKKKTTRITDILNNKENEDQQFNESTSYFKSVRNIFKRPMFVFTMLTISSIYFVVTGVQFWISDYMIVTLNASQGMVFTAFALVSITAPTLGVLLGGNICDRLGGYSGERAIDFCLVFALFASIFAIPIPIFDNFYLVSICLWLLFFFGGAILPTLTGMMLTAVPQKYRSLGSSLA
jgi:MFS transporter, Spinster family, sphingosine-1-phosphate transporter